MTEDDTPAPTESFTYGVLSLNDSMMLDPTTTCPDTPSASSSSSNDVDDTLLAEELAHQPISSPHPSTPSSLLLSEPPLLPAPSLPESRRPDQARPQPIVSPLHRDSPILTPPLFSPHLHPEPSLASSNYLSSSLSSLNSLNISSSSDDDLRSSPGVALSSASEDEEPRHRLGGRGGGQFDVNLVLPSLPGMNAEHGDGEERVRDGAVKVFVVCGKEQEGERECLIEEASERMGLVLEEWEEEGGWMGVWAGSAAGGERVRFDLASDDELSTSRIIQHATELQGPLLEQFKQPALDWAHISQLVGTGMGRGTAGWIDCVVVLVGQDMSTSISALRALSPFIPTLPICIHTPAPSFSTATSSQGEFNRVCQHLSLVDPFLTPASSYRLSEPLVYIPSSSSLSSSAFPWLSNSYTAAGQTPQPLTMTTSQRPETSTTGSDAVAVLARLFAGERAQDTIGSDGGKRGLQYLRKFAAKGFMRQLKGRTAMEGVMRKGRVEADESKRAESEGEVLCSVCRRSTSTTTHHSYDPLHLPTAISSLFRSLRRIELIFSSFFLFGLACFTTGRML